MDYIFNSIYGINADEITMTGFIISIIAALILGAVTSKIYSYKTEHTGSFALTLAILPAIVSVVILMASGSLGAGIAVAGTFSLVRFRSVPGTAKEIGAIFLSMAIGLACGMGYVGIATVFALVMCLVIFLYESSGLFSSKKSELQKVLNITIPEDLEYAGIFDDIFAKYTDSSSLKAVKTTNLGSLNRLTYSVAMHAEGLEKSMIDELRTRNGNLEITLSVAETPVAAL